MQSNNMSKFELAVTNTPNIAGGYKNGLQAFGRNSSFVEVDDTKKLEGSVDIDECTKELYPDEPRWDYALGYGGKAYFIEVHPASTSDVKTVIEKAKWLDGWLNAKAKELKALKAGNNLYWVASGKVNILRTSRQYRMLMQSKILLCNRFKPAVR